jgi:predicted dehydrogenase
MSRNRPPGRPLAIGVLGCANIARQFTRDVEASANVRVVAVGSRNAGAAAAFAVAQGIGRHHGSYEALLADPAVDAVYVPLPNSLHAEWAIRAAEHGKHVLCEKPLALGLDEARSMFAAAQRHGVVLLESFPYLFQPQTADLVALLASDAIGAVRSIQACFGFTLSNPIGNIRMNPALGGGALLDAGSYPLSLIRLVMGCAPQRVHADATWADTGVDLCLMATLHYADGRRAQLACAMDTASHRRATIVGSKGTIETEYLNHTSDRAGGHPHGYLTSQMRIRRGIANSVPFEDVRSATGSGFRFAAETFAGFVSGHHAATLARATEASIDNAATLEAIARSARLGTAVELGHA